MRLLSKHTASLGLPGAAVALGGTELQPGANEISDAEWQKAKQNDCVKAWLAAGLISEIAAELPIDIATESADDSPKGKRR